LMLGARLAVGQPGRAGFAEAWNFGPDPGDVRTVGALADALVTAFGRGAWRHVPDDGPHEAGLLKLASDKAGHALGWSPRWRFERAVVATAEWYRAFYDGRAMAPHSERQIADYLALATA